MQDDEHDFFDDGDLPLLLRLASIVGYLLLGAMVMGAIIVTAGH